MTKIRFMSPQARRRLRDTMQDVELDDLAREIQRALEDYFELYEYADNYNMLPVPVHVIEEVLKRGD